MMNEDEFIKFMLERIEEICEETHQVSDETCPFCCQPEYPVRELENGELEEISPDDDCSEADYWTIDHYDDCLITILDKQYKKIKEYGIWY